MEFSSVFNVDGAEDEDSPSEGEAVDSTPQARQLSTGNRRNSRTYNEGDADRLLGLGGRTLAGKSHSSTPLAPSFIMSAARREGQSDFDEDIPILEESGTETDGLDPDQAPTLDSHSQGTQGTHETSSSPDTPQDSLMPPSVDSTGSMTTPTRPARSNGRMATIAAGRGLHIDSDPKPRRISRQPGVVGLPHSPRPHNTATSPRTQVSSGTGTNSLSPIVILSNLNWAALYVSISSNSCTVLFRVSTSYPVFHFLLHFSDFILWSSFL